MRKIVISLLLFLSISVAYSQVHRSGNLVAISGKKYYLHKVEAKQTMYAISKAYAVSIRNILEVNHKESTNLKEGELLKIPYSEPTTVLQSLKYKHYIVKKGDTLYSLAKELGVSQEELITLNAGVEVALVEGRRLIVPIVSENLPRYDAEYYYHIVQSKETLSSIGRRYNISFGKLKKANAGLNPNRLRLNDEVRIPIAKARAEVAAIRMVNRKTKEQREVLVVKDPSEKYNGPLTKIPEGWKPTLPKETQGENAEMNYEVDEFVNYEADFREHYDMVVLLPLKKSFSWMKNYYKGMLLAIQENGDVPMSVSVYDSGRSRSVVKKKMHNHEGVDFVVGPYAQEVFPAVLPFANERTTIVSLLSKNDAVYHNEHVLQLNTTENSINHEIAKYVVTEHFTDNVIYFDGNTFLKYQNHDGLLSDKVKNLTNLINRCQDKGSAAKKNYQEDFEKVLNTSGKNIVIVPESNYKVVSQILNSLNVFSMHDVEVVGYYKWKLLPNIEPEALFNLNFTYFTPFHYLASEQKVFFEAYKERFQAFPDDFSFMGYKTMSRLLRGIKEGGRNFYQKPLQKIIKHKQGGYENIDLHKVQFNQKYQIIAE